MVVFAPDEKQMRAHEVFLCDWRLFMSAPPQEWSIRCNSLSIKRLAAGRSIGGIGRILKKPIEGMALLLRA
jgi:hypothetical protein